MADATDTAHDAIDDYDRVFLEKLHLATTVISDLGEDEGVIGDVFQTELFLFRDRVERALLLPAASAPIDTTAAPVG